MAYLPHFHTRDLGRPSQPVTTSLWLALMMLSIALSVPKASAQDYEANSQYGLQIHWSEVSVSSSHTNDDNQLFRIDGHQMGYGISASYYFDPTISIRATYERATDFTSFSSEAPTESGFAIVQDESGMAEHFSLALVPQFDISPSVYGFAHIGISRNEFRGDFDGSKTNDTSLVYGLGFGYRLAERFTLAGEYSRAGSEYDVLRVALGYRF